MMGCVLWRAAPQCPSTDPSPTTRPYVQGLVLNQKARQSNSMPVILAWRGSLKFTHPCYGFRAKCTHTTKTGSMSMSHFSDIFLTVTLTKSFYWCRNNKKYQYYLTQLLTCSLIWSYTVANQTQYDITRTASMQYIFVHSLESCWTDWCYNLSPHVCIPPKVLPLVLHVSQL